MAFSVFQCLRADSEGRKEGRLVGGQKEAWNEYIMSCIPRFFYATFYYRVGCPAQCVSKSEQRSTTTT